jgi:hypothetical protein
MKSIRFRKNNIEEMHSCAVFISQLIREGVTFEITDGDNENFNIVKITLTGGY